jgi:hypothetical protein
MKRHLEPVILALCAILPLAAIASLAAAPAPPPAAAPPAATAAHPKAVAVDPIKDAGPVAKGEKLNEDFDIRNDGNAPLEITEVKPACGCTVASFDKSVAPGKSGKVHVVLETVTFTGPIAKGVTVFTNDPGNPQIELTVRAKIVPYIDMKPGYARYVIVRGEAKEGTIAQTLWAPDGSPMEIVKVESPWPYLTVGFRQAQEGERLPDVDPKIKQWRVDIKLSSEAPVGPLAGYVTVHTTHARQKLVEIPVSGFVRPVVAVTPPRADFGQLEIKGPVRKTLEVRSFSTEPVKLIGVDPVGQGIETKIEPLEEGRDYVVRVTLNPGMPKGPFHNKLTIHTDSSKSPVVEVELTGTVL